MKRVLLAAALVGIATLASPRVADAQHARGDAPAVGTAAPASPPSAPAPSSPAPSSTPASAGGSSSGASPRAYDGGNSSSGSGRRRGNAPVTGTAVPRTGGAGGGGPVTIGLGGFYPWGYVYGGGLGIYDGFYGGYYGAYDPWYGFSPIYAPSASAHDETGAIRLKVKPSDASVYVDGYYVGVVDEFDGAFQRLHLEPGAHRLEIRAQNYQPLSLDVWITEDLTITYRGDLKP